MEQGNLENKFKSIIASNEPHLDHDEIWNNIEPKLNNRKRRRFVLFWFLIGGLSLALFQYFNPMSTSHENNASIIKKADQPLLNETTTDFNLAEVEHQNTENTLNVLTDEKSFDRSDHKKMEDARGHENNRVERRSTARRGNRNNLAAAIVPEKKERMLNQTTASNRLSGHSSKPREEDDKSILKSNNANRAFLDVDANKQKSNQSIVKELIIPDEEVVIGTDKKMSNANDVAKNVLQQEKKSNSAKQSKSKTSDKNKRSKTDQAENEATKKPIEIKKKWRPRGRWIFELQPFAAPVWAVNAVSSGSGDAGNGYAKRRQDAESTLEAYAGGVNIRLSNSERKFIVMTGINYRRLNQRYDRSTEETTTETVIGPVAVVEDAQGRIIETEMGQKEVTTTIESNFRTYNHYTYFSVPIGIGTKWSERKYSMAIMGGIDYNLGFKFNGTILDTDGSSLSFKDGANDAYYKKVYKKSSGIDFWVTAEYARKLDRRMLVSIAPKIQLPTTSIHRGDFNVSQRFYLFGLDLGVIYLLNR